MKAWPVEEVARACASDSRQVIHPGELTNELERQVTGELVNIILHQHHLRDQEIAL